jgi:hypothetical protein
MANESNPGRPYGSTASSTAGRLYKGTGRRLYKGTDTLMHAHGYSLQEQPYFDVEIDDCMVTLRYSTVAIKYKKKHFKDLGDRLFLKFPYWCFRFFAEIPIE